MVTDNTTQTQLNNSQFETQVSNIVSWSIFTSDNETGSGLRIEDSACFDQIVASLNLSTAEMSIAQDINLGVPTFGTVYMYDSFVSAYTQLNNNNETEVNGTNVEQEFVGNETMSMVKRDAHHDHDHREDHEHHEDHEDRKK